MQLQRSRDGDGMDIAIAGLTLHGSGHAPGRGPPAARGGTPTGTPAAARSSRGPVATRSQHRAGEPADPARGCLGVFAGHEMNPRAQPGPTFAAIIARCCRRRGISTCMQLKPARHPTVTVFFLRLPQDPYPVFTLLSDAPTTARAVRQVVAEDRGGPCPATSLRPVRPSRPDCRYRSPRRTGG